jgi:hypothetical protein
VLEAHLLLSSVEQNKIIKIFSVAAVVLMPPTLIASIYGMNFKMWRAVTMGSASFDRIRHQDHDGSVFLYAFDLIELNGDDLRRDPPTCGRLRSQVCSRVLRRVCG